MDARSHKPLQHHVSGGENKYCGPEARVNQVIDRIKKEGLPDHGDSWLAQIGSDALQTGELSAAVRSPLATKKDKHGGQRQRDYDRRPALVRQRELGRPIADAARALD